MIRKTVVLVLLYALCLTALSASWDGTYRWVNNTNKSNWGKVKELTIRAESVDKDYLYNLYLVYEGEEYRIFPLIAPDEPGYSDWHDYDEKSEAAEAFRTNNRRMNKTIVNPGKWMMGESEVTADRIATKIIASAFSIHITIDITYEFSLDENGNKQLTFSMDADQDIAKGNFFQNVAKGSDGKFTLTCID